LEDSFESVTHFALELLGGSLKMLRNDTPRDDDGVLVGPGGGGTGPEDAGILAPATERSW
jgi:hypothetical protein